MSVRILRPMDVAVLNVPCPKCGAKAGDLCVTKRSRLFYSIGNYHQPRREKELESRQRGAVVRFPSTGPGDLNG